MATLGAISSATISQLAIRTIIHLKNYVGPQPSPLAKLFLLCPPISLPTIVVAMTDEDHLACQNWRVDYYSKINIRPGRMFPLFNRKVTVLYTK